MIERRRLAVRHLLAALILLAIGVLSFGCVPQEFGVGTPCLEDAQCFSKKCVALTCAAANAANNVPFPTIDGAAPSPDASTSADATDN